MKKLFALLALPLLAFGQSAFDLSLQQVDATGASFNQILVSPAASSLLGFSSGKIAVNVTLGSGLSLSAGNALSVSADAGLPSQTSNSGKFLTTNGTVSSWSSALVTSIAGTAAEITASASTGSVTLSLPSSLTFTGKTVTGGTYTGAALNGTLGATTPAAATVTSLTDSGLTAGRVPFASTAGLLADAAALTFNSGTGALSATSFVGSGASLTSVVNSITGTAGNVTASGSTGAVTLSLPTALTSINSITSVAATALALNGNGNVTINTTNGATLAATFSGANTALASNLTVSGTGTSTFAGSITLTQISGNPFINIANGSGGSFPLYQLTDNRTNGHQWNIENGRTLGSLTLNDSNGAGVVATLGGTLAAGSVSIAYTTPGTSTTAAAILGKSLGLSENLYVGGTLNVASILTLSGGVGILKAGASADLEVQTTTASSSILVRPASTTMATFKDGVGIFLGGSTAPTASQVNVGYATEATTGGAGSLTTPGGFFAGKKLITASTLTTAAGVTYDFGADVTGVTTTFVATEYLTVIVGGSTKKIALVTSVP